MCMCIHRYMCVYVYIYIYKERKRYIHTHIQVTIMWLLWFTLLLVANMFATPAVTVWLLQRDSLTFTETNSSVLFLSHSNHSHQHDSWLNIFYVTMLPRDHPPIRRSGPASCCFKMGRRRCGKKTLSGSAWSSFSWSRCAWLRDNREVVGKKRTTNKSKNQWLGDKIYLVTESI